ncbi:ethylbenzene dehydrogenase-related protein [Endothiovibrio diazotrophicus]
MSFVTHLRLFTVAIALFGTIAPAGAGQRLEVIRADAAVRLDGVADEAVWGRLSGVTVNDVRSDIPMTLKAFHDAQRIYLLVTFPDPDESRSHKSLVWNPAVGGYDIGFDREDSLVLKWNLSPYPVDLTLSGELEYRADVWFWKAFRTDPVGYADDKLQIYTTLRDRKARALTSRKGNLFYLTRSGDAGDSAYVSVLEVENRGERIPGFTHRTPTGSRADVRAKGGWRDGTWTVELQRRLITGHDDDVPLAVGSETLLGVSRYEIAGREVDPRQSQPLHGAGEVGELIRVKIAP